MSFKDRFTRFLQRNPIIFILTFTFITCMVISSNTSPLSSSYVGFEVTRFELTPLYGWFLAPVGSMVFPAIWFGLVYMRFGLSITDFSVMKTDVVKQKAFRKALVYACIPICMIGMLTLYASYVFRTEFHLCYVSSGNHSQISKTPITRSYEELWVRKEQMCPDKEIFDRYFDPKGNNFTDFEYRT